MRMTGLRCFALGLISTLCVGAQATVVGVAPFTGLYLENFDSLAPGSYTTLSVFSGNGVLSRIGTGGAMVVGGGTALPPFSLPNAMFGRGVDTRWVVNTPVTRFGGLFRMANAGVTVTMASFKFYDASNVLVGAATAPINPTSWQWIGWRSTVPFVRVDVSGNGSLNGYVGQDNIRVSNAFILPPVRFQVFRGRLISGTLNDLVESDDSYLVVRNGTVATRTESPITLIVAGHSPIPCGSSLGFAEECHVSIRGLTLRVDLLNAATMQYEQFVAQEAALRDERIVITPPDPCRFIDQNTGEVVSRLRIRADGPIFTNTWDLFADQVQWEVEP